MLTYVQGKDNAKRLQQRRSSNGTLSVALPCSQLTEHMVLHVVSSCKMLVHLAA